MGCKKSSGSSEVILAVDFKILSCDIFDVSDNDDTDASQFTLGAFGQKLNTISIKFRCTLFISSPEGFNIKSDAPRERASIVIFAPFVATAESTSTGILF